MGLEIRSSLNQERYPSTVEPIDLSNKSRILLVRSLHDRPNTQNEIRGASALGLETGGIFRKYSELPHDKVEYILEKNLQLSSITRSQRTFYLTDAPDLKEWRDLSPPIPLAVEMSGALEMLGLLGGTAMMFKSGSKNHEITRRGFIGGMLAAVSGVAYETSAPMKIAEAIDPVRHLHQRDATPEEIAASKKSLLENQYRSEDLFLQLDLKFRDLVIALKAIYMNEDTLRRGEDTTALVVGADHANIAELLRQPVENIRKGISEYVEKFDLYKNPEILDLAIIPKIQRQDNGTITITYMTDEPLLSMLQRRREKYTAELAGKNNG